MSKNLSSFKILPELVIFDLDDCLWSPETCHLNGELPSEKINGNLLEKGVGVKKLKCGEKVLELHDGALLALQQIFEHNNNLAKNDSQIIRLAVASSSRSWTKTEGEKTKKVAPRDIALKSLTYLEVFPGLSIKEVLDSTWRDHHNYQEIIENNCHCLIGSGPPPQKYKIDPFVESDCNCNLNRNKSLSHFPRLKEKLRIPYEKMLFFDDSKYFNHVKKVRENCVGVTCYKTPRGCQIDEWYGGLQKFCENNQN